MRLAIGAFVLTIAAALVLGAWRGASHERITAQQARLRAEKIALDVFSLKLDLSSASAEYDDYHDGRRPKWTVIPRDSSYWIAVDAQTGSIREFINNVRRHEQWKGVHRTGRQFFKSESQVRSHLLAWAKRLGVPSSCTLTDIHWLKDGQVKDGNSAGYVGGTFRNGAGRIIALMTCDPQDGALVSFSRED